MNLTLISTITENNVFAKPSLDSEKPGDKIYNVNVTEFAKENPYQEDWFNINAVRTTEKNEMAYPRLDLAKTLNVVDNASSNVNTDAFEKVISCHINESKSDDVTITENNEMAYSNLDLEKTLDTVDNVSNMNNDFTNPLSINPIISEASGSDIKNSHTNLVLDDQKSDNETNLNNKIYEINCPEVTGDERFNSENSDFDKSKDKFS